MQRPGYERFALVGNPFHDLASESLEEIAVFHVTQEADEGFEAIKQEVLERARKAFVFVVGPLGSGKTQRLRVTAAQAAEVGAYAQYLNLGEAPPDPVAAIAVDLAEAASARKAKGAWGKDLQALAKGKALNPETAGRTLAEALAALAPSYLLLNDLDALPAPAEAAVLHTLLALVSHLQPGVMVAVACQEPHFATLNARAGPLASRVNRVLQLRGLADDEAELLLAKRMAGKRLIEDLDAAYPFTRPAVAELNKAAAGSPRRLLQLADLVLDQAVKERAFQVGPDLVQTALSRAPVIAGSKPVTPSPAPAIARPVPRPAPGPAASATPAPAPAQPSPPPAEDRKQAALPAPVLAPAQPSSLPPAEAQQQPAPAPPAPKPAPKRDLLARGLFGAHAKP